MAQWKRASFRVDAECFSPEATGISGSHIRLTRGVRPRLEGKEKTPLSSRVATGMSWSPLGDQKGVQAYCGVWREDSGLLEIRPDFLALIQMSARNQLTTPREF